ncbi:type II secretion system protein N [Motiliproteus coralliicola]|uniref:type II secretion system protein N n=1 Tax=Motiliproteus coralliicola TaxID=2283196 RepID=UPI0014034712|nr:type II secretion system protein N [Motiliproteus coralliicola]
MFSLTPPIADQWIAIAKRCAPASLLRWPVALLLLVIAGYQANQFTKLLMPMDPGIIEQASFSPALAPTSAQSPVVDAEPVDPDEIASWSLFGQFNDKPVVPVAPPIKQERVEIAEPTKLSLQLEGIVFASQPGDSKAIIHSQGKRDQYGIGEPLPVSGNVSVHSVFVDRIILDNDGQLEALLLYSKGQDSSRAETQKLATGLPSAAKPRPAPQTNQKPHNSDRRYLADVISFSMSRENGVLKGFKVDAKQGEEKLKALGLMPGDIVTSVNNIVLDSPRKALELFKIIRSSSKASFQVLRENGALNLDVSLEATG